MWKDWFFYTRSQRRVIVLLLIILVLLMFLPVREKANKEKAEIAAEPLLIADSLYCKIGKERQERERNYKNRTYTKKERTAFEKKKSPDTVVYETRKPEKYSLRFPKQEKYSAGIVIDANSADTSTLKKIPGIGRVISKNIVSYRNRLGGFYDVGQLLEVKYVDSTLLVWFQVKSDVFRRINVNKAGLDELRSHPYMDFHKAKAIVDFRRKRGRISGMSQISMFKEFSDEDISRLSHYFTFE
ncbi:MAG: ComEA family DNA-binding protein [Phocaeicola sp.]